MPYNQAQLYLSDKGRINQSLGKKGGESKREGKKRQGGREGLEIADTNPQ